MCVKCPHVPRGISRAMSEVAMLGVASTTLVVDAHGPFLASSISLVCPRQRCWAIGLWGIPRSLSHSMVLGGQF